MRRYNIIDKNFVKSSMSTSLLSKFEEIEKIQLYKWEHKIKRNRNEYTIDITKMHIQKDLSEIIESIGIKLSALIDTLDDLVDNFETFSQKEYLMHLILQELLGFELLKDIATIDDSTYRNKVAGILYEWVYKLVTIPYYEQEAIKNLKERGCTLSQIDRFYDARVLGTAAHIKLATEFLSISYKDKTTLQHLLSLLRKLEAAIDDIKDMETDIKQNIQTPAVVCGPRIINKYIDNLLHRINSFYYNFDSHIAAEIYNKIKNYTSNFIKELRDYK